MPREIDGRKYNTVKLEVEINLDPIPGWGNYGEDYQQVVQRQLNEIFPWYKPTVTIISNDSPRPKLRPEDISPVSPVELAREIIAIQGNSPEARIMAEEIEDEEVRAEVLNYIENAEDEPAY